MELWAPADANLKQSLHHFRIRFIYNGHHLSAKWCTHHCTVAAFIKYLDTSLNLNEQNLTSLNLTQECQI
ncbi:hypothetical protein DSO57_1004412 [Entomophthora muscae]|uniref:Uncharacterized protein n=1 Tax=Entomophthora muscae TaxID=34485 RepID=A0ACC2TJE9_9FUNG|nr:hypothetical protein DSO57_1004412 [Entomophthora muscae]